MKYIIASFLLLSSLLVHATTPEDFSPKNLPEPVNSMVWRSGRPTPQDYQFFAQQGIKAIINLEDNMGAVQADANLARQFGMVFYSFPMDPMVTPNDQAVGQILSLLKNPRGKILVHCFHGQDRTGMIIGLERVFIENWRPQLAYQEMLQKGFHPAFKNLDAYFKEKTKSRLKVEDNSDSDDNGNETGNEIGRDDDSSAPSDLSISK